MTRGVGGLMKSAARSVAKVPGAEEIVLQAVRDIFSELKQLRRENDRLRKQVDRLQQRLDAGRAAASQRPATGRAKRAARKPGAKRTASQRSTPTARRAPRRRGGILGDLLG